MPSSLSEHRSHNNRKTHEKLKKNTTLHCDYYYVRTVCALQIYSFQDRRFNYHGLLGKEKKRKKKRRTGIYYFIVVVNHRCVMNFTRGTCSHLTNG